MERGAPRAIDDSTRAWICAFAGCDLHMLAVLDPTIGKITYRIRERQRWREFLAHTLTRHEHGKIH